MDNPSLNIEAARDEILALHEISPELIEQIPIEEYERLPELIGKEPTVTINFSESGEQVEKEIEQEARDAGMTVEEYAANGYEPSQDIEVQTTVQPLIGELQRQSSIEPEKTQKISAGKRKTMGL